MCFEMQKLTFSAMNESRTAVYYFPLQAVAFQRSAIACYWPGFQFLELAESRDVPIH